MQFFSKNSAFLRTNIFLYLPLCLILVGCDRKPANLTTAKEEVARYYDNGAFQEEVKAVVKRAIAYFDSRVCCNSESAVIFDIDDTLLWSYYEMKMIQFGFVPKIYHEWVLSSDLPPVPHVKLLYDFFVERGCKIIMITSRQADAREATVKNLSDLGFNTIDLLVLRQPDEMALTAQEFKSKRRAILENQGYKIIAAVGDQYSDLEGGYTCYKVKIPNYTYILY